jgi:hypothetical protein
MDKEKTEKLFKDIDDFRIPAAARLEAAGCLSALWTPDLSAVCEADFHCHSFFSDGYCSPSMKVFEAFRRGMKALSICDHDVFDGQEEAVAAGKIFGIDIVPAAEFYTDRPGVEIAAYFPDRELFLETLRAGTFDNHVETLRRARERQLSSMTARIPGCFAKMGFSAEITAADIDKYLRNGMSAKGDISVVMWQKHGPQLAERGIASDVKDFQAKYTTKDAFLNVPLDAGLDLSPEAYVRRIRDWGGLPSLAHPTELRNKEKLGNKDLADLIECLFLGGLQIVEVDGWRNGTCPETGLPQTEVFDKIRRDVSARHPELPPLLFVNGSDDHNQPGEGLELGCGKNKNLRPEFGRALVAGQLRGRLALLRSER